jgi:hypothetical protein
LNRGHLLYTETMKFYAPSIVPGNGAEESLAYPPGKALSSLCLIISMFFFAPSLRLLLISARFKPPNSPRSVSARERLM